MAAKKATKTANVCTTIYEGKFDINFDCVGIELCRFAICPVMPPQGDEDCFFLNHGSCRHMPAKQAALEGLRNRITKELKNYDED